MGLLKGVWTLGGIVFAGMTGVMAGDEMRSRKTGQPAKISFVHTNKEGEQTIAVNTPLTNLLPAVLAGLLFKPRLFAAFMVGGLLSYFIGDHYENEFWKRLPLDKLEGVVPADILGTLKQILRPSDQVSI